MLRLGLFSYFETPESMVLNPAFHNSPFFVKSPYGGDSFDF